MADLKSNQTVQPVIADDFKKVTFKFAADDPLELDMTKLHPDIVLRAACVGMAQVRIVDAAAIPMTRKDGTIIPASERAATKHARMAALIAHYETGTSQWSRVSEAGPTGGYLFDALCKKYGHMKAPSEIRAWLDGLDDKAQTALREDDEIAPIIADLKKAKMVGKPVVDTKGLLAGLTATPTAPETTGEPTPTETPPQP